LKSAIFSRPRVFRPSAISTKEFALATPDYRAPPEGT